MPTLVPETCLWAATGVALVATWLLARQRPAEWPAGVPKPGSHRQPPPEPLCENSETWVPLEMEDGDRRRAARRGGNPTPVHLLIPSAAAPRSAAVIDRNSGGVQLVSDTPLPEGLVVQLRPCHAPEDTPWTEAVVRWCAPAGRRWQVGCKFTGEVPWGQLLLFG
jgi:hypothetical protein